MGTIEVNVYGQLLAASAELEAMKLDNWIRQNQGFDTFNYSPDDFWSKASEIHSITNQLFK